PAKCMDADGDTYASALCGGDDCDDGDPAVHPGAPELCNGVDDDCDGVVDDHLAANACEAPLVCRDGACAEPLDAGTDGGAKSAPEPAGIQLAGGCGLVRTPERSCEAPCALALAAAL